MELPTKQQMDSVWEHPDEIEMSGDTSNTPTQSERNVAVPTSTNFAKDRRY